MKGLKIFLAVTSLLISLQSCRTSEPFALAAATPVATKGYSGSATPDRIYVPRYYSYKNGRYRFIRGHYRPILFRKAYWKRSLKGRTNRSDSFIGR